MSYFLGTAPQNGPPGPLQVPGAPALGDATCAMCRPVGDAVTAAGEMTKMVTIGAVALGALWFMKRRARR